jgi:hypothetical protein
VAVVVAVAHEEMHPQAGSQAGIWDKRSQRDSGSKERGDHDREADDHFDSRRQSGDGRRE